jgi:lactoylglutathione lyase
MTVADGTEWKLEGSEGQTLVFENGRIAGHAGVNRYAGEYTLRGGELTLGPLAVTRMAGPPAAMESERRYLDALGRAARAAVQEGTLVLADGEGNEVLRFAQSASSKGDTPTMELIHTCYRITDPDRSVAFYEALGFEERRRMPIRDEAINIFMGLPGDGDRLELTYNFGVDSYELGTGYGHVAVTVDDIHATLARLAEQGIEPERPPYTVREGGSLLCFVRDPDGYRIELIERSRA